MFASPWSLKMVTVFLVHESTGQFREVLPTMTSINSSGKGNLSVYTNYGYIIGFIYHTNLYTKHHVVNELLGAFFSRGAGADLQHLEPATTERPSSKNCTSVVEVPHVSLKGFWGSTGEVPSSSAILWFGTSPKLEPVSSLLQRETQVALVLATCHFYMWHTSI